jgi:hypothetical protein
MIGWLLVVAPLRAEPVSPPTPAPAPQARLRALADEVAQVRGELASLRAGLAATADRRAALFARREAPRPAAGDARVAIFQQAPAGHARALACSYELDGIRVGDGDCGTGPASEVFRGAILGGAHVLTARLVLGTPGPRLLSYLDAYRYALTATYLFRADAAHPLRITVKGVDRGLSAGATGTRLAVEFDSEGDGAPPLASR